MTPGHCGPFLCPVRPSQLFFLSDVDMVEHNNLGTPRLARAERERENPSSAWGLPVRHHAYACSIFRLRLRLRLRLRQCLHLHAQPCLSVSILHGIRCASQFLLLSVPWQSMSLCWPWAPPAIPRYAYFTSWLPAVAGSYVFHFSCRV